MSGRTRHHSFQRVTTKESTTQLMIYPLLMTKYTTSSATRDKNAKAFSNGGTFGDGVELHVDEFAVECGLRNVRLVSSKRDFSKAGTVKSRPSEKIGCIILMMVERKSFYKEKYCKQSGLFVEKI